MSSNEEVDTAIEQWKIRRLIKQLELAKGNGTSMISLIIPPKDEISRINRLLQEEHGTATNIKSRVNRLSVLGAITSTQQRLKLYNRTPPNGLVMYCGEVINEDGKQKKVTIDFEPFKPINTSMYLCDNKFHTEDLSELLESDDRFGFIIMDGNGSLFGVVQGSSREILHKFSVDLPKKHGRGGQSALRFARLRLEKRHNYVRKVGEVATQMFITNDKPNVAGLIMAGSADFKNDLQKNDQLFDLRLSAIVLKTVDVSYGGENGFNQAIELASDTLKNVKFVQEKKLVTKYMDEIAQDTGKICFGVQDTVQGLEMGAVEHLIVWENLDINRYHLRDPTTEIDTILFLSPHEEKDPSLWKNDEGQDLDVVEKMLFTEWVVEHYKDYRAKLDFITDRSQEGNQFVKGFGGLGGLLRYRVDFEIFEDPTQLSDDDDFM
eukprot:GEMP01017963.1.p1 GENE.GEMP01017963.1~~GEMP01017963.1.p1  ORF type:complete len:435 (+),score=66.99 GEMP01017963.1:41-1345(+)